MDTATKWINYVMVRTTCSDFRAEEANIYRVFSLDGGWEKQMVELMSHILLQTDGTLNLKLLDSVVSRLSLLMDSSTTTS
jgi:hypothetical protein